MNKLRPFVGTIMLIMLIMLMTGCETADDRLARLANDSSQRQAEQNLEMARLNQEISQNHRRVVETTEESRQSMLSLEKDLQAQRDRLDAERRTLASERYRESLLAPIISSLGLLLVCGLPLILCWYLLTGLRSQSDEELSELLLSSIIEENQSMLRFTGQQPAIAQTPSSDSSSEIEPPF